MSAATAFPVPWGYDQLVGHNTTNIFNASLAVWRESASNGIALDFTIGMLPILLATIVYVRMRKIVPALFVAELSTIFLHIFNLMNTKTAVIFYVLFSLGIALNLIYSLFNKT